jgi:hypothetical protein
MNIGTLLALLVSAAVAGGDKAGEKVFTFKGAKVGELPAGWKAAQTGKGTGSVWKIVEDKTAPGGSPLVLAQSAKGPPGAFFNLCVAANTKYKDLDLTVAFKAVDGEIDQGGGPVWRYQDANNYYICRMNPLENNFRVYKVIAGKRIELASSKAKVETGTWHTIRVVHKGNQIKCYLDGKLLLEVTDEAIQQAGKIGLWSKSDAQTYFANLRAKEL